MESEGKEGLAVGANCELIRENGCTWTDSPQTGNARVHMLSASRPRASILR